MGTQNIKCNSSNLESQTCTLMANFGSFVTIKDFVTVLLIHDYQQVDCQLNRTKDRRQKVEKNTKLENK